MVGILDTALQRQVTSSHRECVISSAQETAADDAANLADLSVSRLLIQDTHLDSHPLTRPRNILRADGLGLVATALQSPSSAVVSNTTFDTFRANCGQSGFLQISQTEVGEQRRLQRQPSIISSLSLPSRAPAELVCLLGDKDGKLKAGATVRPQNPPSHIRVDNPTTPEKPISVTTLERAKSRPRVGLNLRLAGDSFVQGQTISGQLIVHVRSAESPVRLANNKLRVIGFECLTDNPTFHIFFRYSCRFEEISYASEQIFSECPDYVDEEGYREAREGTHVLPFEMTLPEDSCFGKPKGVLDVRCGVSVRYIILASVDLKDPDTNQLSLAHFYRACSAWPSLSIHDVLFPSTRPLVSTAVVTLPQGGLRGKLKLSARLPRPSYLSGQHCYVHVQILNDTHKTVRSLRLTLIRTITVYRPQSGKGVRRDERDHISSSYQTKTFVDEISKSRLAIAENTTRRCASSRGWWAGVSPQERATFTHSILIPPGTLSMARTELVAVDHAIRVTIYASAGTLGLTSHLSVTLPIRVLSMLSVDPLTSVSRPPSQLTVTHTNRANMVNGLCLHVLDDSSEHLVDSPPPYRTRPPSLEHPQDSTGILSHYHPTPSPRSIASASDESSPAIDESSLSAATMQDQRLPAQGIEAQSPRMNREGQSFQHRVIISPRSSIEDTTPDSDSQAGSSAVLEGSMDNDTRALSNTNQSSPRNCIISPIPSLGRARARALTIAGTSAFSHLGQTELQGDSRNPDAHGDGHSNGDGRRDFRSYDTPFARRVKEKVRQVHAYGEASPRVRSGQTVEPRTSTEDAARNCESEMQEPLSHSQQQSGIKTPPAGLCQIRPLHVRTARPRPRSLMGPRKLNVVPAPGSVMDRVRTIEGRNLSE